MNPPVRLYNVNTEIAEKVFSAVKEFNRGRRADIGYYAISVATEYRSSYGIWRIFNEDSTPLFIAPLAITIEDAVRRAMNYLQNCNIYLNILDNSYFEPYYGMADDIVPFGKYQGKKLSDVYYIDPNYILWIANKFEARSRKDERLVELAKGFRTVYFETVIQKKNIAAASRYIGKKGEKLTDMQLTVLYVRLQVDSYKDNFYVDQHVVAVDVDGNRFSFVVKASGKSLAPDILSCYSKKISVKQSLFLKSAKVLSHYDSRGIHYTRLGYVKFSNQLARY